MSERKLSSGIIEDLTASALAQVQRALSDLSGIVDLTPEDFVPRSRTELSAFAATLRARAATAATVANAFSAAAASFDVAADVLHGSVALPPRLETKVVAKPKARGR